MLYLIIINIISLILFKIDKDKSIKHKWRIKESTLLIVSLLGGSLGSFIGMHLFHHKTNKLKFKILIPLFLIIHIILLVFYIEYL